MLPDVATAVVPEIDLEAEERWYDERGSPEELTPERYVTLTPASTITPDRMAWVWDKRLPEGAVGLVVGEEGKGKTALVGHIAARLTRGDLPGGRFGRPGDVVYIGHEDDRATVLVPRLIAAGADLTRFHFLDMANGWMFSVGGDCDALRLAMRDLDVAAIIIDPLDSHLGSVDTHRKSEVQASIARLAQLAQEQRCVGIGIAHFNKGSAGTVRLKVVGSIGFTSAVRAVIAVGPHPERPDSESVAVLSKVNGGDLSVPAVRFRIEGTTIPDPNGGAPIDTAAVVMLGEEAGLNPDSIVAAASTPEERSTLEEAVDWLQMVLADGPIPKAELSKWANSENFSPATLKRAAKQLGVGVERDGRVAGRPSTWALPEYSSEGTAQTPLSRTHHAADQHIRTPDDRYGSDHGREPYPLRGVADLAPLGHDNALGASADGLHLAEARANEARLRLAARTGTS